MLPVLAESFREAIPVVAIIGGIVIAVVAITFGTITSMVRQRQQEQSRRELAAYVAEGSISPEDARKLLEAKMGASDSDE